MILTFYGCGAGGGGGGSDDSNDSNSALVANAGADQIVTEGTEVDLDGSSSKNADGTGFTYHWTQIGDGTTVTLADEDTVAPKFVAPSTGTRETLTFQLAVEDSNGLQDTDTVAIKINVRPVADAGSNQTFSLAAGAATQSVTLKGTSKDIDGTIVSEQWAQTGGTAVSDFSASGNTATFTIDATKQTYTFTYTVTDNDGAQQTDTVLVDVAEIILSEGFANADNWAFVDDMGTTANWGVVNGQLRQLNFLANGNLDGAQKGTTSYHIGTYAYLTGALSGVSDYRISVDINPLADGATADHTEGNDVGIMFRRQDANNYYRVSMNAKYGFTRFEKVSGGNFKTLAVDSIGYVDNQTMNMTAEVNGDTIMVWIDGDPVFSVVDPSPIASGTVALYCQDIAQFDNVVISEPQTQPKIVISTPLAYSVALTPDDGTTLSAKAVVLNAPTGASVVFTLDDSIEATASASGNVYTAQFTGVADGEHEIMASLMDGDGQVLDYDINSTVGTGGDYYVAIGDSITNGMGDNNSANNDSADGRIVSQQGYEAVLSDALTTKTGLPKIVFNEGIEGDRSADLSLRLASIMERHPGVNKVLMMVGTNDSGIPIDASTFATTVEDIAGKITNNYNKKLWIAKIMPTYVKDSSPLALDATKNALVENYNTDIDSIIGGNTFLGPNFYTAFNGSGYYSDYLHPNDSGYQLMATQWKVILEP